MDIKEGNKLIAEFMTPIGYDGYGKAPNQVAPKFLKYHKSWDWLMPVVEKINSLNYSSMIIGNAFNKNTWTSIYKIGNTEEQRENIRTIHGYTMLENTYKTVVEFIKWYNNMKKKKYVVFQYNEKSKGHEGARFLSSSSGNDDSHEHMDVVSYHDTIEEAQTVCDETEGINMVRHIQNLFKL